MFTSRDLKAIITEARPIVERQLDDALVIASFREKVTAQGGDWSQVKALVKAMIQDDRDEYGGHKRVSAILSKAGNALGYADMLGLGNLNEKNSFEDEPEHDAETGEVIEQNPEAKASEDNAITDEGRALDTDGAGDASRLSDGSGSVAPIRRMSMTPLEPREAGGLKGFGFTVRFDEPAPLTQGVAAVGGGSANHPVASAAVTIADQSKPNPICRDPGDCGVYASWAMPCQACKAAAAHRSAA